MEQVQSTIKEQRAHTDASLDAERATTDSGELVLPHLNGLFLKILLTAFQNQRD